MANSPHGPRRGRRPFGWPVYLASVAAASGAVVGMGLVIDAALFANGVRISIGFEALVSAVFGVVFMIPGILLVWRLGIVTLPQYLLGVILLFLPITLLTLLIYPLFGVRIEPPEGSAADTALFSAFVRLLRAAALAPTAILVFWAVYHVAFGAVPRRRP